MNIPSKKVGKGVIGIIEDQATYLMIRRAQGLAKAGYWCFPGGHLEPGENARQAIQRELQEELGILSIPECRLGSIRVEQPHYILAVWKMKKLSDTINPNRSEVDDYYWVPLNKIATIDPGLASNQKVVNMLYAQR